MFGRTDGRAIVATALLSPFFAESSLEKGSGCRAAHLFAVAVASVFFLLLLKMRPALLSGSENRVGLK